MTLTADEAEKIAFNFFVDEWQLSPDDQDWFRVLTSRLVDQSWYIVEIGIEGLPDKWIFQVYDTRQCDPNYTFTSPISRSEHNTGLADFPEKIAEVLASERNSWIILSH
ncbi:MAG: hypothetical protein F6K19_20300 [Cyanothece sp. SIO1E1]|nr:hypothetical protein [Cyanothece sp. SIO1E1]